MYRSKRLKNTIFALTLFSRPLGRWERKTSVWIAYEPYGNYAPDFHMGMMLRGWTVVMIRIYNADDGTD